MAFAYSLLRFTANPYVLDMSKYCLLTEIGNFKLDVYKNRFSDYLKGMLNSPAEIVDDFMPPVSMPVWRCLLREPELLDDQCKIPVLAVPDDLSCSYLLSVGRPRSKERCNRVA